MVGVKVPSMLITHLRILPHSSHLFWHLGARRQQFGHPGLLVLPSGISKGKARIRARGVPEGILCNALWRGGE